MLCESTFIETVSKSAHLTLEKDKGLAGLLSSVPFVGFEDFVSFEATFLS